MSANYLDNSLQFEMLAFLRTLNSSKEVLHYFQLEILLFLDLWQGPLVCHLVQWSDSRR